MDKKMLNAVETYFKAVRDIRATGADTGELSYREPLITFLNALGKTLEPKVTCVGELANQGAGHPDVGLFTKSQMQRSGGKPRAEQLPERGVVEVKAPQEDVHITTESNQVRRYAQRYNLVLVTNYRSFALVRGAAEDQVVTLEEFSLAERDEAFDELLAQPRRAANQHGQRLIEYLLRALQQSALISEPKDLAWFLASYARDALTRVNAPKATEPLNVVRKSLEEALGMKFEGDQGRSFFHSTLVQTLFYGVFAAWVLWAKQSPAPTDSFNWREAAWHLRVPVLRALFRQLSDPARLQALGLVEVLDWTSATLDRVSREEFFKHFNEEEAVTYFYEPFLEAFDPVLRKKMGVWYTPPTVVNYMVARVDKALRDDLGIADGLAAKNVYILDPCCGTGAYLAAVLKRIAKNLEDKGLGATLGATLKEAVLKRVAGFEIMPAPFVVAHLQVGLTMEKIGAPLNEEAERAEILLTNALTRWKPTDSEPLPFPELNDERDRADKVKQNTPILVVLGNPPYDAFADVAASAEERELTNAYKATQEVREPEGHGLNDLYVRFFRMAERRIAEKTKQGVVCFISNYSWLDGLSFTGMRERYIQSFDAIRIDCLNGDVRKGGTTPDGEHDPSIFTIPGTTTGIQVGTAITTLVKTENSPPPPRGLASDISGAEPSMQL